VARPQWRVLDVRLALVGVAIVAAWIGIGLRLVDVQALQAEEYAAEGLDQRVRQESLPAARGTIFDRDGVEVALTIKAVSVVADPALVEQPRAAAELLAPMLDVPHDELLAKLSTPGSRFAYLARRMERKDADAIVAAVEEAGITGIFFRDEFKRVYPAGALASQLIGFVQDDEGVGLEGLEYQYDEALAGEPGVRLIERDPYRNPIPQGQLLVEPPQHGADMVLTIDREVQFIAEQALIESLEQNGAVAGTAVVIEVATGEVLAMATVPTYDPNDRSQVEQSWFRNRAASDMYEPGSTLKVVTIAAALEEGKVEPSTEFFVPAELSIELDPEPKVYTDVGRRKPEAMSVAEIVSRSSNIGTILIQQAIGNELHHHYLEAFGLGRQASGDLPGEATGRLHAVSDWCETTCGPSTAIGYRVDVTPLQMAAVFAAIGNDGVWVEPHVVREIIHADGSRDVIQPIQRPVVSEQTAVTLQRMLQGVVEAELGTGRRAAIAGYSVGGKTGTTEKYLVEEGRYSEDDRIASFIGIAPAQDPRVAIAVVLDSPHGELADGSDMKFGGVSAAPVFARIAEAALHRLGLAPDVG
jgi:cell division protein FtsI (penicillin-binding protein 3)